MSERRKHRRLEKGYRLEYGPFESMATRESLKASALKNLSGGGVLFHAGESFPAGTQLFLKIYIEGWCQGDCGSVRVSRDNAELLLKAIAEVLHVVWDTESDSYLVGARFSGSVEN